MLRLVTILVHLLGVGGTYTGPPSLLSTANKGGSLALIVIRERSGEVMEDPEVYLSGDRFQLLVTIPGAEPIDLDVAIIQQGETYFLFPEARRFSPGSRIPIPGAFRITGVDPTHICLFAGRPLIPRTERRTPGARIRRRASLCKTVTAPGRP